MGPFGTEGRLRLGRRFAVLFRFPVSRRAPVSFAAVSFFSFDFWLGAGLGLPAVSVISCVRFFSFAFGDGSVLLARSAVSCLC